RIEHAERSRERVGEHAVAEMYAAAAARPHHPARAIGLVPTQRLPCVVGRPELLDVPREIHPRVSTGGPDGKLEWERIAARPGDVDRDVVEVRRRIGHGNPIGDAERLSDRDVRDDGEKSESGGDDVHGESESTDMNARTPVPAVP